MTLRNLGEPTGKLARRAVWPAAALLLLLALSRPGWGQTTLTVNTLTDSNDGGSTCTTSGTCSLRDAIAQAAAGDTISLAGLTGTITLGSALPAIAENLTITGPGANVLTVSGASLYGVFTVNSGTVAISGLTIANGRGVNAGGGFIDGGGLYVSSGTVSVNACAFTGNSAIYGGGASNNEGTLTVTDSTFTGNSANVEGGGIFDGSGTLTVTNSTFTGNTATDGGGIYTSNAATVTNSTFSGNTATSAGGIDNEGAGTLTAYNNVFSGNSTTQGDDGAGIYDGSHTVTASYNVYWNNLSNGSEDDCQSCTTNANAVSASANPLLPLAYYGGTTETMLPVPDGAAVCAADASDVPGGTTTDQRGFPLSPSICASGYVDAGAVQSNYLTVTTGGDANDGSCTSGTCSLYDAITAGNTATMADIAFASSLNGSTITLTQSLPALTGEITLVGPGANELSISGGGSSTVGSLLTVGAGAEAVVYGLTLTGGKAAEGGAIINGSGTGTTLTVTDSAFIGNSATENGGAIFSPSIPATPSPSPAARSAETTQQATAGQSSSQRNPCPIPSPLPAARSRITPPPKRGEPFIVISTS